MPITKPLICGAIALAVLSAAEPIWSAEDKSVNVLFFSVCSDPNNPSTYGVHYTEENGAQVTNFFGLAGMGPGSEATGTLTWKPDPARDLAVKYDMKIPVPTEIGTCPKATLTPHKDNPWPWNSAIEIPGGQPTDPATGNPIDKPRG